LHPLLYTAPAYASPSFPPRRSSDLASTRARTDPVIRKRPGRGSASTDRLIAGRTPGTACHSSSSAGSARPASATSGSATNAAARSEEHTSELQSREKLVCRRLLEKT